MPGYHAADQCFCFHYIDSAIPLLNPKFQTSFHLPRLYSLVCVDMVGNPEDRFCHDEAHIILCKQ